MNRLNVPIGNRELCAWQPWPGVTWVQTRSPIYSRRLAQRKDGRLVLWSVAGGYLRIYEFKRGLGWAQRLIARYIGIKTPTNGPINRLGRATAVCSGRQVKRSIPC